MLGKHVSAPETARLIGMRPAASVLVGLMFVAAAFYFPWRLGAFNPDALALSWVVYIAELAGFAALCLHVFMTMGVVARTPPAPLENVSVDIFVTTFDEPVSMLRRTLAAAKLVRRAARVVLLDDGDRAEMRKLAEELGVVYLARTENTHAKAGNLNNGLAHSSAEFVATFDADHAPAPDFLEHTLGFFRNPGVAVVQTPQDFYNLESFQHRRLGKTNRFWTEQSLFFRVIQPGKDRWNAAFYCGSCAVLRRSALDRIGGFATGTVTEDLHTSIKLHKAGFQSIYHAQSLAFGIAPSSFEPYETQRVRWGKGAMQVWRKEGVVFARGLTMAQRLCYFASIFTYFDAWQKAIFFLLPAFVLVTGIMPLTGLDWEFLARFLPWFALSLVVSEELGRGYARSLIIEQYNFLRCPAFLSASLSIFLPSDNRFRVTPKAGLKPGASRGPLMAMALVPILVGLAVPFGIWRYVAEAHLPMGALIANIIWAVWICAIAIVALRFAWGHAADRRVDYRFTTPFPFDVHLPSGGWGTLRALDMTPDGVRLNAPLGLDFAVGKNLQAILRLPGGPAQVSLRVRHREVVSDEALPQRMELGCELSFENIADQDRLNAILYGAGLEQRLLDLSEQGTTLIDLFDTRTERPRVHDLRRAWAPGAVEIGKRQFDIAAQPLSEAFDHWRVMSYEPLPPQAVMRLPSKTGNGESVSTMRVIRTQTIPAGASELHISAIELSDAPARRTKAKNALEPWMLATATALAVGVVLVATASAARGETLALAGGEAGANSTYAYVGAVTPLPSLGENKDWAMRIWADRLTYSYRLNGAEVDAEAYGGELALVRRWSGAWGYANASVGARARTTDLSPNDLGNSARGAHWDLGLQADGRAMVGERWALNWLAGRELDQRNSIVRLGLDRDISAGAWRLGAETTRLWGPRYGESQAGLIAQWRTANGAMASVRAGASHNDDGDSGAYVGLGLAVSVK